MFPIQLYTSVMSWSIKSIGTCAAVKAAVLRNTSMPHGIKDAIIEIIDVPAPENPFDSAFVDGWGHTGGGRGSIGKLEVYRFNAAEAPPQRDTPPGPAPAAATPSDHISGGGGTRLIGHMTVGGADANSV